MKHFCAHVIIEVMKATIDALCISTDFNEVRFTSDAFLNITEHRYNCDNKSAFEAGSRNCYEEAEAGATSIYKY